MSLSNILIPNQYHLYCDTITANNLDVPIPSDVVKRTTAFTVSGSLIKVSPTAQDGRVVTMDDNFSISDNSLILDIGKNSQASLQLSNNSILKTNFIEPAPLSTEITLSATDIYVNDVTFNNGILLNGTNQSVLNKYNYVIGLVLTFNTGGGTTKAVATNWQRIGNIVTLTFMSPIVANPGADVSSYVATAPALVADFLPTINDYECLVRTRDNGGTPLVGFFTIKTNGVISLFRDLSTGLNFSNGTTNSGSYNAFSVTYSV